MFFKKKCPNCGAKITKECMTCTVCGASLTNCLNCGTKIPKEFMSCTVCGASLTLGQVESQVTEEPLEVIEDIESTTLCETCQKELECFQKGIFGREICTKYEPLPTVALLKRDSSMWAEAMVKACPECGSENIHDCKNNPLLEDNTIGHCLECEIYWCLECGYVFESVEKGMECPHWEICADCSDEHGYLDQLEFEDTICSTCEHYDDGCQLEDPLECDKRRQYACPYEGDVPQCPKVEEKMTSADVEDISSGQTITTEEVDTSIESTTMDTYPLSPLKRMFSTFGLSWDILMMTFPLWNHRKIQIGGSGGIIDVVYRLRKTEVETKE